MSSTDQEKPALKPTPFILLVEDSQDDAYFFGRALKRCNRECRLLHVPDGGAAVQVLREALVDPSKMPDLIFLDLKMPVLSGFEVLAWIQEQSFACAAPVIVLSGSDQQSDRKRVQQLGVSEFWVKPITSNSLAERLQTLTLVPEPIVCDH